jgi:alpha-L-fucosidase
MVDRRSFLAGAGALGLTSAARGVDIASGPVMPDWSSLIDHYRYPDWFRDAKLGFWAHWGPQSVPEQGDWYGRFLYIPGEPAYDHHLRTYGHPADTGMIDLQTRWTGDRWDPEALVAKYQKAGARYLVALACHHDNFDCYDSRHHGWNSTRLGPKRDVVGAWAAAARAAGMKFGVSNHAAHAWHWFQPAYSYDPTGPRKGERYDAFRLRKADGAGKPWQGLDPQDLYTGPWMAAPDGIASNAAMCAWHDAHDGQWLEDAPPGAAGDAYCAKWLLRQIDLVSKYRPDLCIMDNYGLPFGRVGLAAAADYYNRSIDWHGRIDVALTAKKLKPHMRFGLIEEVERGFADHLWDEPWQTETCIGDWFYNIARLNDRSYRGAENVIQRLADIVSKNGNLLLSIPQPGNGAIDGEEEKILDGMGAWIAINGEAIYGSRPWRLYGEGPTRLKAGMKNEDDAKAFTARDIRFTTGGGALYALFLGWPSGTATIEALAVGRSAGTIERVALLGGGTLRHRRDAAGLHVEMPPARQDAFVPVLRIDGRGLI